jgi:cytochrome c-type biogenesis protein CcmH
MIWIVFATMTGAAVLAFLWPLAAKRNAASRLDIETNLYRAELADIERDVKRGLMTETDAQAAKAEAARRLLAATAVEPAQAGPRGVKYASLLVILAVPILTVGLYLRLGAPDYGDMPLQARLQAQPTNMDMAAALARIEGHLAQEPDDARGWEIMAQVYTRLERPGDAAKAYRNLVRLQGASPDLLTALGQSLVFADQGRVNEEAVAAFERALIAEPDRLEPRFYLALAAEQQGDKAKALEGYARLLADAPVGAPFAPMLRERIAKLGGEAPAASSPGAAIAAMPPAERETVIRGMVEGLAARLAANGGSLDEWSRLVRAYTVLHEPEKARLALGEARKALAANAPAMAALEALANELGLGG